MGVLSIYLTENELLTFFNFGLYALTLFFAIFATE